MSMRKRKRELCKTLYIVAFINDFETAYKKHLAECFEGHTEYLLKMCGLDQVNHIKEGVKSLQQEYFSQQEIS